MSVRLPPVSLFRRSLIAISGVATLLSACAPSAPSPQTAVAEIGDIRDVVTAVGVVEAALAVDVRPESSGRLVEVYVRANQRVVAGQILARLRPERAGFSVQEAGADIEAAEAALSEASARAAQARSHLANRRVLADQGVVSGAAISADASALETAEAVVRRARAELDRAQIRRRAAERSVQESILRAPMDGIVLTRAAEVGQLLSTTDDAAPFTVVSELSRMRVVAYIAEPDIGRVQQDASVSFTVDAYPGEQFNARIVEISRAPRREGAFVSYPVVLDVSNPDGRLLPGMTATVEFVRSESRNVLRVPVEALYYTPPDYRADLPDKVRRQLVRAGITDTSPEILKAAEDGYLFAIDSRRLFVVRNGRPEFRRVKIGGQTHEFVQITEGLEAGELIATANPPEMTRGRR